MSNTRQFAKVVRRAKWRHLSFNEGTERVRIGNEFLVSVCDGSNHLTTWRRRGLWQPVNDIFGQDGVHFNSLGNYKFFKCLRGAILQACRTAVSHTVIIMYERDGSDIRLIVQ